MILTQDNEGGSQDQITGGVALIDSNSTHNFINDRIAHLLRLPMVPIDPFKV